MRRSLRPTTPGSIPWLDSGSLRGCSACSTGDISTSSSDESSSISCLGGKATWRV